MKHCRTTCRVIYGDTDNMGVAYYANYLRWFEIGRTEFFRSLGMTYKNLESKGFYLPVSEVYCKFIASVGYDDLLVIETAIDPSVKAGLRFNYTLFVEDREGPIAHGFTKHACKDRSGRVVRPPGFLRELYLSP